MVYVDEPIHPYGRMIMCHMIADTTDELHLMAKKIGLKREWYQNNPDHPHYDISKSKRILAIQLGAIEISNRTMIEFVREKRRRRLE